MIQDYSSYIWYKVVIKNVKTLRNWRNRLSWIIWINRSNTPCLESKFSIFAIEASLLTWLLIFLISRSPQSPITTKRIANIIACLTYDVFKYSCRGLYEKDKFLFTLLLALKIDMQSNLIKHKEFSTFIKGNLPLKCADKSPVSASGPFSKSAT